MQKIGSLNLTSSRDNICAGFKNVSDSVVDSFSSGNTLTHYGLDWRPSGSWAAERQDNVVLMAN